MKEAQWGLAPFHRAVALPAIPFRTRHFCDIAKVRITLESARHRVVGRPLGGNRLEICRTERRLLAQGLATFVGGDVSARPVPFPALGG